MFVREVSPVSPSLTVKFPLLTGIFTKFVGSLPSVLDPSLVQEAVQGVASLSSTHPELTMANLNCPVPFIKVPSFNAIVPEYGIIRGIDAAIACTAIDINNIIKIEII